MEPGSLISFWPVRPTKERPGAGGLAGAASPIAASPPAGRGEPSSDIAAAIGGGAAISGAGAESSLPS
jgi:outer membrane lipoprotein SlyB